jgi:hypothetical protein
VNSTGSELFAAWRYAKVAQYPSDDGPIPRRAIHHVTKAATDWNGELVETKHGVEKLPTDSRAKSTPSSTSKRSTASTQVDDGPRAEMEVKPTAGTGFRTQEKVPAEKTVNR